MTKATKGYKREHGLTVDQLNAIDLLVIGKNDQETADIVGLNRVTVTKWKNYDFYFQAELNKRRRDIFGSSIDKMRSLIPKSLERLEEELDKDYGWKVALEIIKITGIGDKESHRIGHADAEKLIKEEAEKRSTADLFSMVDESSIEDLITEYKGKLETTE
ncbi:hypothetical protein [Bacillus nitroreducens]